MNDRSQVRQAWRAHELLDSVRGWFESAYMQAVEEQVRETIDHVLEGLEWDEEGEAPPWAAAAEKLREVRVPDDFDSANDLETAFQEIEEIVWELQEVLVKLPRPAPEEQEEAVES
jgi:hypothetical protein